MNSNPERIRIAAETIITRCLALPDESELAIIADETTLPIAQLLTQTAESLNHRTHVMYFHSGTQIDIGTNRLGESINAALHTVAGTILCVNSHPAALAFRDNIRRAAWLVGRKVAHMPGATWRTLLAADADYDQLEHDCEGIALALAKGKKITIESFDQAGNVHILNAKLSPWERLPIISDGIIYDGSWGNVPSGETYIAPIENTADGEIVINGSLPKFVLTPQRELILRFQSGRLTDIRPYDSRPAQHLLTYVLQHAQEQGDRNWNNLAEIGLGVNKQIRRLTGNPLLDEKKYGSVHIALGDNIDMGGETESMVHCDMVCLRPKVMVDDNLIMTGGKIVLRELDWREDFQTIRLPAQWRDKTWITPTTHQARDAHGILWRLWDTSSGRLCAVPVGDDTTTAKLVSVWRIIKSSTEPIKFNDLFQRLRIFEYDDLHRLVYLLEQYGLVQTE